MNKEETKVVHKQGKPWTNVGIFDSYENAANMVMHMSAAAPTYNFKIKRCGPMGSQYAIKKRIDPKLAEAEAKLNEKSKLVKEKALKSKKSKKR